MSSLKFDKGFQKLFKSAYEKQKPKNIPSDSFLPPDTSCYYFHNVAPFEEKTPEKYFINYSNYYANVCFSTYPVFDGVKFGKPIADFTQVDVYKNLVVMSMADGCGMVCILIVLGTLN